MRARGLFVFAALGLLACSFEDDKQVVPPVVVGMLDTTAPTYDDGQVQIFEVRGPVELPLRRPNDGERAQGSPDPYPRVPFQLAADTRITARFTLTNLDDKEHYVELLVDPWNEFVRYFPGVTIVEDETQPNFSGIQRAFVVGPKQRVEGIITPDDVRELATDLATAMKLSRTPPAGQFAGPILYNRAFNIQNRSSEPDIVLGPYIPTLVAGMIGFDLGLRTYEASKVAVEVVVDIEDVNGDRVIKDGDDEENRRMGRPGTILTPPAAPAP